jgi:hypothetical protein
MPKVSRGELSSEQIAMDRQTRVQGWGYGIAYGWGFGLGYGGSRLTEFTEGLSVYETLCTN